MGYLEQFEADLTHQLEHGEDTATIVKWVSDKVLESYKNGLAKGNAGEKVIRKGASRSRRVLPPQAH